MKLFTVRLSDDERARLEAHRAALGLRSHSDVIRHWIATEPQRKFTDLTDEEVRRLNKSIPTYVGDGRTALNVQQSFGPVPPAPGSRLKKR